MTEHQAARRWLHALLSADDRVTSRVGQRLYHARAPQEAPRPYVVYSVQSARTLRAGGRTDGRIWTVLTVLVRGVTDGPDDRRADRIAHAIDEALESARGTVTLAEGVYRVTCAGQQAPVMYEEPRRGEATEPVWHAGGLYELYVEPEWAGGDG